MYLRKSFQVLKKRIFHIVLSTLLSFLVLFGGTAKEFIHQFTGHEDTIHHQQKGLSFENKHHHCSFLNDSLTPFYNDNNLPVITFHPSFYLSFHVVVASHFIGKEASHFMVRGPPFYC